MYTSLHFKSQQQSEFEHSVQFWRFCGCKRLSDEQVRGVMHSKNKINPKGPSTQYQRTLVQKTLTKMQLEQQAVRF